MVERVLVVVPGEVGIVVVMAEMEVVGRAQARKSAVASGCLHR